MSVKYNVTLRMTKSCQISEYAHLVKTFPLKFGQIKPDYTGRITLLNVPERHLAEIFGDLSPLYHHDIYIENIGICDSADNLTCVGGYFIYQITLDNDGSILPTAKIIDRIHALVETEKV